MLSSVWIILLLFGSIINRNGLSAKLFDQFNTKDQKTWDIVNYWTLMDDYHQTDQYSDDGQCIETNTEQNNPPYPLFTENDTNKNSSDGPLAQNIPPDLSLSTDVSSMEWLNVKMESTVKHLSENLRMGEKFDFHFPSMVITLEKVSTMNLTDQYFIQSMDTLIRFPPLNLTSVDQSILINLIKYRHSSIITLSLHHLNGTEISIQNTISPFELRIPHAKNLLMPPLIHYNVNSTAQNSPFMYHYINLTHSNNLSIALHVDFQPTNINRSYLFILRFHGMPHWNNKQFDTSKLLCPQDRQSDGSKYVYFLDNTIIAEHQWAILGIHEMDKCDENAVEENHSFSSDYSLRIFLSGCYYLDQYGHWQSDGLRVGSETNEYFTQCLSTHLTTYASGVVVLPNPIDFSNLNPDFARNITIYVTIILIILFYLLTLAYSYLKDKVDANMLLVLPLHDNNPQHKYLYQLVVFTGMRKDAGTTSKVHLILSGNNDETDVRTLSADRRILNRGHCDSFIMAVPKSLGQLNYLRIWHDNSGFGSDASWFLKYVIVRNLQTMETTYFICQKWLAVEKDSGEIDRTLTIASDYEQEGLKHVLSKNAYRSMADNHLWFSIFAYHLPSAKRFTRIQRCTCCFVLLLMTLLMNIMFYDSKEEIENDELNQYDLTVGPFIISKEQISIGVLSEIIVFIPSLIVVALFRRTKARHPRTITPVAEAIERIQKRPKTNDQSVGSSKMSNKKFFFPWWCIIVAYVLSFIIAVVCLGFTAIRGFQYGDDKVRRWLGSILVGLFSSILLTQPLKVLSLALLFSFFCRRKSQGETFIEEEDPIEDFTVSTIDAHRKFPPKSILARARFDPHRSKREQNRLKELRATRLQEIHAAFTLRELGLLLVFLGTLYTISYANRDVTNAYRMVYYLRHQFLQIDFGHKFLFHVNVKSSTYVFENIRSTPDYWEWLENIFLKRIQETAWDDKISESKNKLLMHNRTNRIIDWPVLRQLRVKNETCSRKGLYKEREYYPCESSYKWYNEDQQPFGVNVNPTDIESKAFTYSSGEEMGTLIYSSSEATYMTGGYIQELKPLTSRSEIAKQLKYLREHQWIDQRTRAVFLTFGLYNQNTNFFVYCSILFEQLPVTGQIALRASFQPFRLTQLYTGTELIYCLIYLALVIYYMIVELKTLIEKGRKYIREFWSYVNWMIIICSWVGVGIQVYREVERKRIRNALKIERRKYPINLQFLSYLDNVLIYILAFCCFFGTIKILRLLRFNRRLSLLHLTLQRSVRQLLGFLLMASFVFVSFTCLFYFIFHSEIKEFSSWLTTCRTCFEMIALHFSSVHDLQMTHPFLAGLCLLLFILLAVFLLTNMFISIVVDNFNDVRREQNKRGNDIELLRYIRDRVKRFIGTKSSKQVDQEISLDPASQLPGRIDKLMSTVDEITLNY